eukprot:521519_1
MWGQTGSNKGYKFGSITKSMYGKVTNKQNTKQTSSNNTNPKVTNTENTGSYKFGDITKSTYNKLTHSNTNTNTKQSKTQPNHNNKNNTYQFGDYTKNATKTVYNSIIGSNINNTVSPNIIKPIKEDFLQKQSLLSWTYRKQWVVLNEFTLYTFKTNSKQYINPMQQIDLRMYSGVRKVHDKNSISIKADSEFEIFSVNNCHRFIAESVKEMNEWMQCIWNIIGKSKQLKPQNRIKSQNINNDIDTELIAFYIIELEYNEQKANSDPKIILRNQNFILSVIIWSYMHQPSKLFDENIYKCLNFKQREMTNYYWKEFKAVKEAKNMVKPIGKGAKNMVKPIGKGLKPIGKGLTRSIEGGPMMWSMAGLCAYAMGMATAWNPNPSKTSQAKQIASGCVLLPLSVIAGTVYGTTLMPGLFCEGYKEERNRIVFE